MTHARASHPRKQHRLSDVRDLSARFMRRCADLGSNSPTLPRPRHRLPVPEHSTPSSPLLPSCHAATTWSYGGARHAGIRNALSFRIRREASFELARNRSSTSDYQSLVVDLFSSLAFPALSTEVLDPRWSVGIMVNLAHPWMVRIRCITTGRPSS